MRRVFRRKAAGAARSAPHGGTHRDALLSLLPHGGVVAEIGVWKGDFSAVLLERLEPSRLHLVDPWTFQPDYADSLYGGQAAKSQADMDVIFAGVTARFEREIERGVVSLHRMPSLDAASMFDAGTFDAVYVDGDHTYEAVVADLAAWAPLVRVGGYLAGDDYSTGKWWGDGVTRAVDEFAGASGWRATLFGSQFAFERTN